MTHSGDSYKVTTASFYLLVGQACTRFRVLQFYGLKIGEFVLTCGATVKQSHLSLEPGLNLYWQRFPQVTCHVTYEIRFREKFVTQIFSPFDKFDLSSIVYRPSSTVYRLSSIVCVLAHAQSSTDHFVYAYISGNSFN